MINQNLARVVLLVHLPLDYEIILFLSKDDFPLTTLKLPGLVLLERSTLFLCYSFCTTFQLSLVHCRLYFCSTEFGRNARYFSQSRSSYTEHVNTSRQLTFSNIDHKGIFVRLVSVCQEQIPGRATAFRCWLDDKTEKKF